jgi:PAS domain S-box-containing protein
VAKLIMEIYPNEIKFYYKYANFLKMIINNEQESEKMFDHAASIYSVLSSSTKKATHYGGRSSEELIFGENTAVAVLMISLATKQVGEIIHSNDEIYRILGYKRKHLIGKKVNMLMPSPIAMVHDRFLKSFLNTAKRNVIDKMRQVPAVCSDGYLRPVSICVKLYP